MEVVSYSIVYHDLNLTTMDIIYLLTSKRETIMNGTFDHFSWTQQGQVLYEDRNTDFRNTRIGIIDPKTQKKSIITNNEYDFTWPVCISE